MKKENKTFMLVMPFIINGLKAGIKYKVINGSTDGWIKIGDPLYIEYDPYIENKEDEPYSEFEHRMDVSIFTHMRVDQGKSNDVKWGTVDEAKKMLDGVKAMPDKKWAKDRMKEHNDNIKILKKEYKI